MVLAFDTVEVIADQHLGRLVEEATVAWFDLCAARLIVRRRTLSSNSLISRDRLVY